MIEVLDSLRAQIKRADPRSRELFHPSQRGHKAANVSDPHVSTSLTIQVEKSRSMHSRLDPPERIVVQHFHMRTLYPEIYLARTRRALPPDPTSTQPRTTLQRRPNHDH